MLSVLRVRRESEVRGFEFFGGADVRLLIGRHTLLGAIATLLGAIATLLGALSGTYIDMTTQVVYVVYNFMHSTDEMRSALIMRIQRRR